MSGRQNNSRKNAFVNSNSLGEPMEFEYFRAFHTFAASGDFQSNSGTILSVVQIGALSKSNDTSAAKRTRASSPNLPEAEARVSKRCRIVSDISSPFSPFFILLISTSARRPAGALSASISVSRILRLHRLQLGGGFNLVPKWPQESLVPRTLFFCFH